MSLIDPDLPAESPDALQDKVVLLLGGTSAGGASLAASLAEQGADVAVVYFDEEHERASKIKETVESSGQRCLTFAAEPESAAFPEQVIGRVVEDFGRLDIFIDYAPIAHADLDDDVTAREISSMTNPFSNFEMMAAALGQMTTGQHRGELEHEELPNGSTATGARLHIAGEFIQKPILSIQAGTTLGHVEDLYLDAAIESVTALYMGRESLLDRSRNLIPFDRVETMGEDAVLVRHGASVVKADEYGPAANFVRRQDLIGLEIQTPGGTRIGRIGDLVIKENGMVSGFTLAHTYVAGPIADKKVVNRSAIVKVDLDAGVLVADLVAAEDAKLKLSREGLFGEPSITRLNGK